MSLCSDLHVLCHASSSSNLHCCVWCAVCADRHAPVMQESDILFFFKQVHKLQPGFFIAVDRQQKKLLWVIRGE